MDEIANVQTLPQLPTLQVSRVPLWRHALWTTISGWLRARWYCHRH